MKTTSKHTSLNIHKKEAYAMILVFFTFAYYLRGKEFTMKVNRANLTYLGGNQTAFIVRWRIFI
jgi:hypothetical protein